MDRSIYTFGPFRLSPEQGALTRDGQRVALGQRAFEILLLLVERVGEVVSTADIVTRVWPSTIVDENNLRVHIAALRKVLSDERTQAPYILNVPGRGYRFAAIVERHFREAEGVKFSVDLPVPLTKLIGRDSYVRKMLEEMARNRLMTIVGPGGIGKTSVALAIAHELNGRFVDGCYFIDLTACTDPHSVPDAVAEALQIPVTSATSIASIVNSMRLRNCAIVLDNCEHVIDRTAEIVEAILKSSPNIHVLATSREPLRAESESVRQMSALDVPPADVAGGMTATEVVTFPAVELFAQRVAAVVDGFSITDANAPLIAELCQKLGGNPLAIELAAARVETFGVAGLLNGLSDGLSILTQGRRTSPQRHHTLRATLDWSFALLNDTEKTVFARLGVFFADFTHESVALIVADQHLDVPAVIDALNNLVAKSLVAVTREEGRIAFRLHDLTRAYAREKLRYDPFASEVHRRHGRYLYALVEASSLKQRTNDPESRATFRLVGGESRGVPCSN
ncbi:MAG: winged helix-turn-helix domain-containing protein [Paraburkholderia sp.]|uniref:ATP-binding protein n=1 Tax=Paraburkholderia sp. TaxID=1926495 RepID=UPI003C5EF077